MAMKNLPKKVLGKKGTRLRLSPNWFTNGFWLLNRSVLSAKDRAVTVDPVEAEQALGLEVEEATDEELGALLPSEEGRTPLRDTAWLYKQADGSLARCYLLEGERVYVLEDFAALTDQLGVGLTATAKDRALVFAGRVGVIMPCVAFGDERWVPEELA